MSVVLMDGFDWYTAGELTYRGWTPSGSMNDFETGRFGTGQAMNLQSRNVFRSLPANIAEVYYGAAIRVGGGGRIMALLDGGSEQLSVYYDSTGHVFQLVRDGSVIAVATAQHSTGWHYIEIGAVIANVGGTAEVRVNGATVISFTGDTQRTASPQVNGILLQEPNVTVNLVDDVYVCDNAGGAPTNTFLGDIQVEATRPNGNGNSSQFVGSDGNSTDNYLLVDETTQDGNTTYVQSATVGNKDTYAYGVPTATSGTVYAVQPCVWAFKTAGGTRAIKLVRRLSATEDDGSEKFLSTALAIYSDISQTKPGGGVWTLADFANAEFGVKVTT